LLNDGGNFVVFLPLAVLLGSALAQDVVFPVAGLWWMRSAANALKQVRVAIAPSDSVQSEIASTVTSNDGRFHFTVHKGKYHLTAQRRAQTQQSFGSALARERIRCRYRRGFGSEDG